MAAGFPAQTFGGLDAQSIAFFSGAEKKCNKRINSQKEAYTSPSQILRE